MTNNLNNIIATANDFDDTIYRAEDIPGYYEHFATTFANTLVKMLPDEVDFAAARQISVDGYEAYGDSITGLMEWADKRGLPAEQLRTDFFRQYHQDLRHHFIQVAPHVFAQRCEAANGLERLQGIVRQGIATHGCADEFVRPLLPGMGLSELFEQHAIFGLADSGFLKKSTHSVLVGQCIEALEAEPKEAAYTEDNLLNLKTNKEMTPDLTTVLITNGRPLASQPTYVDYQFKSYNDYLNALYEAHKAPRKLIIG